MSTPNELTPAPISGSPTVAEGLAVLTSLFDTFSFTIGKGAQAITLNGQEVTDFALALASLFNRKPAPATPTPASLPQPHVI